MRKIVLLGLFTLLVSSISNTVFAGNVEECEFLADGNYSKGLYGLCIAYHNAGSDNARERILANYAKKAGPGDPPLPGTGVECPCWDAEHLAAASLNGVPSACLLTSEGASIDLAIYSSVPSNYQFFSDANGCFRVDPAGGGAFATYTNTEEHTACMAGIMTLIEDDFDGIVCNGIPQ